MPFPTFITIGAMKCGTTSLHFYLSEHPEVFMSEEKEINFFAHTHLHDKGPEWYERHFQTDAPIRGESSTRYTKFPEYGDAAGRLAEFFADRQPDLKLIYLVRDPMARIVSHYTHVLNRRYIRPGFERMLKSEEGKSAIIATSYGTQLEQYLKHFPLERILVLQTEDLYKNRQPTLKRVFEHIGADPTFESEVFEERFHNSADKYAPTSLGYMVEMLPKGVSLTVRTRHLLPGLLLKKMEKPAISAEARSIIADELGPEVEKLRSLTGLPFDDWSL